MTDCILCRNLSCGKQKERQAMRECRGLIDSLMNYVQSCVAEENPDDKVNCITSIDRTFIHPPPVFVNLYALAVQ